MHLRTVWPTGSISGLRARGGFEIVGMEWAGGKLTKLAVRSTLGGNLRIRTPNELKGSRGTLTTASGSNPNEFYQIDETPAPVTAPLTGPAPATQPLKPTWLYDIPTQRGTVYTLVAL